MDQKVKEPEIWKPIEGYEGLYEISSWGRSRSLDRVIFHPHIKCEIVRRGKVLRQCLSNNYYSVELCSKGVRKRQTIHSVVALHFFENINNLKLVNHKNGNRLDNYYKNLEWVNGYENMSHYFKDIETTSKYIGVYFRKDKIENPWCVQIGINGIRKHVGYFSTEIEAHQAYLNALKEHGIKNKYAS